MLKLKGMKIGYLVIMIIIMISMVKKHKVLTAYKEIYTVSLKYEMLIQDVL